MYAQQNVIPSLSSMFTWAEDEPPIVIGGSVISTITVKSWSPSRASSSMIVIYSQDKLPLEVTSSSNVTVSGSVAV